LKFEELKLSAPLLTAIQKLNYTDCTPIQEQALPNILEGKDLAGLAQTGTGKTAAFLLPLMERVLRSQNPPVDATPEVIDLHKVRGFPDWKPFHWVLILVPTRELAEQVLQNIKTYGTEAGLEGCAIYGGTGYDKQKEALKRGTTFIVATPGRLIDLYKEHNVDLKLVRAVVFDEADRMFDMGFKDDMKFILERIPKDRQFLVFSATLNLDVLNTAYQFGASPVEINVSRDQAKAENVEDSIYHMGQEEKPKYLLSLIKSLKPQQTIIFSNFKNQIESIVQFLRANDVPAVGISSSEKSCDRAVQGRKYNKCVGSH
jgi:ATP-dependent RNA helicase RhlB